MADATPHAPGAGWPRRDFLIAVSALGAAPFVAAPRSVTAQPAASGFLPMAVWYGGGKARAPMLERDPRAKKDAWRNDVRQIQALGFNTLRAWIDWASGEPEPGRYQFDTLDVLLELAEEHDLRVVLQVYMDAAPQWVGERFPDSLFVSSNGQAIRPETSPGYCRDHQGVRAADTAFYAALAARARTSRAFLGWDLWSEPHVINWANPTWIPNPEFCFCPHTLARFRSWLERRYGSLDALNAAWYRRFRSWDQVEPSRMSTILSYTDYIDWKAFIVDKLGEDLRDRFDAVKRVAPDTIITSHAAGVGLFASPHHWEGQADDWTMARQVDYYGTSFYPKHSAFVDRDVAWRAALLDFTRSFGYDEGRRGFWVGELQGGFGTIAVNVSPTVTPRDLRIWTWSALARGAKGINYYAWYPMSSGYESGGFGLNNLDGSVTERARTAGAIAQVVDRHQDVFLEARPPRAEVAIVYNPLAHFVGGRQRAAAYGGPQGEVVGIERDSLLGAHRAWFPLNVPVDYIHVQHLTDDQLQRYRLVYFAYPLMFPEAAAPFLRRYVEQGGTLVTEARLGWNNERGLAADLIPGMGLADVVGAREVAVETAPGGRTTIRWTSDLLPGLTSGAVLPGRWYKEVLEPTSPAARTVAVYEDGSPAAVVSSFGKGRTLCVGTYLSAAYQTGPTPEAAAFFAALLDWAGVSRPVTVTGSDLEVRHLESTRHVLLFALNHGTSRADARITLRRPISGDTAFDLIAGRDVPLGRADGAVSLTVQLDPGMVMVVRMASV
jgi:beta-galactosidase